MDKEQILEVRKKWYNSIFVKFEIVKCLQHKELAFIKKGEKQIELQEILLL